MLAYLVPRSKNDPMGVCKPARTRHRHGLVVNLPLLSPSNSASGLSCPRREHRHHGS